MDRFLIVDGSALLSNSYYGNLPASIKFAKTDEEKEKHFGEILKTSTGEYTNAIYGFTQTLLKIMQYQNPKYIAFCFDKTRQTFRKRLYEGYKATRPAKPKPLSQQFVAMEKMLANMGFKVFLSNEYEADDIAGSLAARFGGLPGINVTLMTKDFDYVQLLNQRKNVTLWMMQSGKSGDLLPALEGTDHPDNVDELDEESACKRYELPSALSVIEYKALAGDKSDNIPGVKGIGDLSAKKLIMHYKTINNLYADIDVKGVAIEDEWKDQLELRKGNLKKLLAGREDAELSRKLATIKTDILLGFQLEDFLTPNDFARIDRQLAKYEMKSLQIELARMAKTA